MIIFGFYMIGGGVGCIVPILGIFATTHHFWHKPLDPQLATIPICCATTDPAHAFAGG